MNQQPTMREIEESARKLIARYKWQSVEERRLVERVTAWLSSGAALEEPYGLLRLCENAAAEQLYIHCERGELYSATPEEKRSQELAYQDLGNYLFLTAKSKWGSSPPPGMEWQDLVQATLLAVHTGRARLKDPPAFLRFAVVILTRTRDGRWRQWYKTGGEVSLNTNIGEGTDLEDVIAAHSNSLTDPAQDEDLTNGPDILALLGDCLRNDEQRIIALGYILGLKRREILLVFASLQGRYDNLWRAARQRLEECRLLHLFFGRSRQAPAT